MDPDEIRSLLPLTSKAFHILTAFAGEPMNGYQLGLRVEEATETCTGLRNGNSFRKCRTEMASQLTGAGNDSTKSPTKVLSCYGLRLPGSRGT
jgi:hypothetical protein